MPTKTNKSRKGARPRRTRNAANRKRKTRIPKQRIPRGKRNTSHPAADIAYRSCFLDYPLQEISYFQVSGRGISDFGSLSKMLPLLYKCLKKAPEFVDDKKWEKFPTLTELAEYLFGKVKTIIPPGFDWVIVDNYHGAEICIKYFKPREDLYRGTFIMPLEWTQRLKEHRLYNVLLYIIYQVQKEFRLDFIRNYFNDQFIDEPEADLSGEPEDDDCVWLDVAKYREGGEADLFIKYCRKLNNTLNHQDELERLQRYNPKKPLDVKLKKWLLMGFKILENPFSIYDFCFPYEDPDMDNSEPLMLNGMTGFEWSFHDTCNRHADNWRDATANEIGMVEPVELGYYTPKERKLPTPDKQLLALYEFFTYGRNLYFKHFDNSLKKQYDKRTNDIAFCPRSGSGSV